MTDEQVNYPTGVSVQEARALIIAASKCRTMPTEIVETETALHRVLGEDVYAPFDVPGFANSAMDGFALHGSDLPEHGERAFRLIGEVFAGDVLKSEIGAMQCARITTGAPMPPGTDSVVIKENIRLDGTQVWVRAGERPGANIRPAGEDYQRGDLALQKGEKLSPAQLGALASFGFAQVGVARRIRAVLLTTGDELVPPGTPLAFGQIHNSNRYSLGALLQGAGVDLVRHDQVRDDPTALRNALCDAARDADVVLSSGGVSAGEADYFPRLLAELGRIHLWKVRMRPGMPFLFGDIGETLIFSLPGNPVSSIATFLTLVLPALDTLLGANRIGLASWRARLQSAIQKRHARTEFQRGVLTCDEHGVLWVQAPAKQGSGMLRSVADANAFVILPEDACDLAKGSMVDVLPLPGLL